MTDSDLPRSPFAGMADLADRKPVRVLSHDEIERMLGGHRLYLETEYYEGHRANFASADLSRQDFSGLTFVLPAHRGRRLWTVFGANMFLLEVGTDAEHRAGSPLTLAAVAGDDGIGIGGNFDTQGTARAMRGSRHRTPPSSG